MSNAVMDLSILNLAIAYVFVLVLLVIFKARGIRREKMILIATTRMTIQLTIMGYILLYVFKNPSWWLTTIMLTIMVGFAIYNAFKRVKYEMNKELKRLVAISMLAGYLMTALVFMLLVLKVKPWFNPQYFIPISGMIIGNSMTGIALGCLLYTSDVYKRQSAYDSV